MRSGFSLLELLIVIVILGGLIAVVAPGLMNTADSSKRKITCLTMNDIKKRLDMFELDNGIYPDTEEGLEALLSNPDSEKYPNYRKTPYSEKVQKDPWGTPFVYIKEGDKFELVSFGADRKEGGDGKGADIKFSECSK